MHPLLQAVRSNVPAIGMFVMEFASRGVPWIAKNAGLDFLVYDTEHGNLSQAEVRDGVLACRAVGISPLVRVRAPRRDDVCPPLDAGALGIIAPMIETPEQAATLADLARYYPNGSRGTCFGIAHDLYDQTKGAVEVMATADADVMVIPQVETAAGVEAIDEIAAVDGVDVIWVGHYDLSQSLGIPGQFEHPSFLAAMEKVAASALAHGKAVARLVPSPSAADDWVPKGYTVLSLSSDVRLLGETLRNGAAELRDKATALHGSTQAPTATRTARLSSAGRGDRL
jgi:2-keto-3-deoxy-L-rhamnonate aldolase RhmA